MYRKGVSAIIKNKNNEFLLVNLNSFEDKFFAIPGGGVEDGESLEEAVYREIKEELGIFEKSLVRKGKSEIPLRFIFKTPKINSKGEEYIGSERYFFGFSFIGEDNEILLQKEEVRAYKWVAFEDLGTYLLFEGQLDDTVGKIKDENLWRWNLEHDIK